MWNDAKCSQLEPVKTTSVKTCCSSSWLLFFPGKDFLCPWQLIPNNWTFTQLQQWHCFFLFPYLWWVLFIWSVQDTVFYWSFGFRTFCPLRSPENVHHSTVSISVLRNTSHRVFTRWAVCHWRYWTSQNRWSLRGVGSQKIRGLSEQVLHLTNRSFGEGAGSSEVGGLS